MAKEDTDYNPAIRKEIKADAETGRTFKKWKHRAQGAAVGAGTVAAVLGGRKLLKKFSVPQTDMASILGLTELRAISLPRSKVTPKFMRPAGLQSALKPKNSVSVGVGRGSKQSFAPYIDIENRAARGPDTRKAGTPWPSPKSDMASILGVTDLSVGAFREMVESAEKLKKLHVKKWKEMDPKKRNEERKDLRIHRQALIDVENASSDYPTFYSSTEQTTDMDCGVERHPGDLPMDPATLKRKKLNAGQTGPQSPLMPQDPIKKIKSQNGKIQFSDRRTFFGSDANGRPHSAAGTFEPAEEGVSSKQIQRAYNPKTRLTGIAPGKSLIKRQIMKNALARCGMTTEL
jgi:hypothetical protein